MEQPGPFLPWEVSSKLPSAAALHLLFGLAQSTHVVRNRLFPMPMIWANLSARSYATLIIEPKLNEEEQKKLIKKFNDYLENQREKYHSLFLTNYRESNSIARKRISFKLLFSIVNYLLQTE